jgi:myo-inositol 2-dehydrogenase / D-chiro-inositol 1-dehydrogenase
MKPPIRNWRCFDWLGGGRLVKTHYHGLDIMDWAMQDHPVEASGLGGRWVTRGEMTRGGMFGTDFNHHFHEYKYADGTKRCSQCRQNWRDDNELDLSVARYGLAGRVWIAGQRQARGDSCRHGGARRHRGDPTSTCSATCP